MPGLLGGGCTGNDIRYIPLGVRFVRMLFLMLEHTNQDAPLLEFSEALLSSLHAFIASSKSKDGPPGRFISAS